MGRSKTHPPARKVGFSEGIDDEEVALAFSKLQNWPQFKIIRRIPLGSVIRQKITDNSRILDFGCGSGHFLVELHQILKRRKLNPALFGLDVAQSMLDRSQESFNEKNTLGIQLILGDGIKIPIEDKYFEIISSSLSLHHWNNPVKILTEIHRVIKPGGKFILFDFQRNARKMWFKFLTLITKHIVPKALRSANEPLGSLLASYTQKEIQEIAKKSPWNGKPFEIKLIGPFIKICFQK